MDEQPKLALNAREAAELIGISLPLMYEMMKMQSFPVIRIGRRNIIPRSKLEEWLAEQADLGMCIRR